MKAPRTGLGYDDATIPLPSFASTRKVLYVAGGVQIKLLDKKDTIYCIE